MRLKAGNLMNVKELVAILSTMNQEQEVRVGGTSDDTPYEDFVGLSRGDIFETQGYLKIDISEALSNAYVSGRISEPDPWDNMD